MTTYPLPTLACTVDNTGISAPPYADIYQSLQASFQSIYGSDAYIDPDSQDGQMLAIFAQAQNDTNNAAIAVYNQFSPSTAQGAGLSSVVKINGLQRESSSNSTADVLIVAQVGVTISNGSVRDVANFIWALPASFDIPPEGQITVTATCQTPGAITAGPNTVNQINTPTRGWQSVTNPEAATVGAPVETDAQLRQRQSVSTGLPAQTPLESSAAAVADLPGVQQVIIFENDTDAIINTMPAHSIAAVVAGGDAQQIANTLYLKKTPGAYAFGNTSEDVVSCLGSPRTLAFVPVQDNIAVTIYLRGLAGFSSAIQLAIQTMVATYINSLGIGAVPTNGTIQTSKLYTPANLNGSVQGNTYEISANGIYIAISGGVPVPADLPILFFHQPVCTLESVSTAES